MLTRLSLLLIKFYRLGISPYLAPRCRYYPSCSEYSLICFQRFTFLKALWYSLKRILRCHPLSKGGVDPVPEK